MGRRIRVCQVLNRYSVGGAEMVALDIARGLDRDRFESLAVSVIEPRGPEMPEMQRRFVAAGVPAHALHHGSFRDPRTILDMVRFFRAQRPDIIHGHQRFSDYWSCRLGRWAGVPHRIWTRHSVYRDMNRSQIGRYQSLAPNTPAIIAVSDAVRQNCIDTEGMPADRLRTIVNGIDTDRFSPQPAEVRQAVRASLGVTDDELLLLFVGRLSHEKAPEAFPALVARLKARGLTVQGFICGKGPAETSVMEAAKNTPVTLLGLRSDIPGLLSAADLLVSTSRIEGLPLNIMEAMSTGTAFVGPDIDQVLQLIEKEPDLTAGVYRRPPDVGPIPDQLLDHWADTVEARLGDPESLARACHAGRDVIRSRFSLERMVASYSDVYEDVVARRKH